MQKKAQCQWDKSTEISMKGEGGYAWHLLITSQVWKLQVIHCSFEFVVHWRQLCLFSPSKVNLLISELNKCLSRRERISGPPVFSTLHFKETDCHEHYFVVAANKSARFFGELLSSRPETHRKHVISATWHINKNTALGQDCCLVQDKAMFLFVRNGIAIKVTLWL